MPSQYVQIVIESFIMDKTSNKTLERNSFPYGETISQVNRYAEEKIDKINKLGDRMKNIKNLKEKQYAND